MKLISEPNALSFFLLYQKDLLQFLTYKVKCAETAADLTQETYLRIAQHQKLDGIENMRAYLFRIANNRAIDYLRGCARHPQLESDLFTEDLVCPAPEPETVYADSQQLAFLEQAIYDLPEKCRAVFLMCRVEGKSYGEISRELGISPRTVESHIHNALAHLQKKFSA